MGAGIWNLLFGIFCIVGGATRKLALLGTDSSSALVVVGIAMAGWGLSQIWRSRRQSSGE